MLHLDDSHLITEEIRLTHLVDEMAIFAEICPNSFKRAVSRLAVVRKELKRRGI